MYNLEQLRVFVLSAELGSFSACARKMGKAQSAISQSIANLETDLNLQLFDRTTRKPHLTKAGEHLFVHAQAILRQSVEFDSAVNAINQVEESIIKLVVDNALLLDSLSNILYEFSEVFPATSIEVISVPSGDVAPTIQFYGTGIGLMFADTVFPQEVELGFIGHLPFQAVCSPDHPLANLDLIKLSDLTLYRQIIQRGEKMMKMDHIPQVSPTLWSTNSFQCIYNLVEKGIGWAYLPCHLIESAVKSNRLHAMQISFDHRQWSVPVDMIILKSQTMGIAQRWLYNELKKLLDR